MDFTTDWQYRISSVILSNKMFIQYSDLISYRYLSQWTICLSLSCFEHSAWFSVNLPSFSSASKCFSMSNRQLGHFLSTFSHDFAHSLWKICLHGNRFMISPKSYNHYLSKIKNNKLYIFEMILSSSYLWSVSYISGLNYCIFLRVYFLLPRGTEPW